MNDVGTLASGIAQFEFAEDLDRFPLSYISGWLEANVGELNAHTHQDFVIDDTGGIGPTGLLPVEESIWTKLYEIHYYEKASREALRGIVYSNAASDMASGDWTLIKEGDTTIQRQNKNTVANSLRSFAKELKGELDDLLYQYNYQKSSPLQVAGNDGSDPVY